MTQTNRKPPFRLIGRMSFAAMATLAFTVACTPAPHRMGEVSDTYFKLPFVRVMLSDDRTEIRVRGSGEIAIECQKNGERLVYYATRSARIQADDGQLLLLNKKGETIARDLSQVTTISRTRDKTLWIGDAPYRGVARVLPNGDRITVINILHIEDYLFGVVPLELAPAKDNDLEAIKAQAVAARTYTMSKLNQYLDKPFDLRSDVTDQLYQGMAAEIRFVSEAVLATSGVVERYDNKFIDAYYHSTCGGATDCIENVWPKPARPYLVGVSCEEMCAISKYYRWAETFTGATIAERVSAYESATRGEKALYRRVSEFFTRTDSVTCQSPGLRTQTLLVVADGDTLRFAKDRIRWVLGRPSDPNKILLSDYFTISDLTRDNSGDIFSVTLEGKGWGHGVGLCQMGALGMSRSRRPDGKPYTYKDILEHYYTGATLERMY